jgi:hypothetical protein
VRVIGPTVSETVFLHVFRAIDVSQINHHRASHQTPHAFKIERTELFPFGNDHDGVRIFHAIVGPLAIGHIGQNLLSLFHS